jgi:peptide subunit release factor 1 (eRF1)
MMQEQDLHELAELVSESGSVLSLYLHIDPQRRSADETKLSLRRLLAQAAEQGAAPADVERIERFFEHEYDRQGRAVALFGCQARKFWRSYTLPVPVESTCYVGSRPYIKPLSDLWDNYGRVGVILVDRGGARLFVYHLGALEDSVGTLGEEVKHHKQGGWAAQKLQRYEDQEARHNLKDAAAWADDYLNQHRVGRLVLAGTPENLAEFRGQAPRSLDDKVVGQTSLGMNATPAEAWERAFEVAQAAQRQAEESQLEQVITAAHKGGAGALGLADTVIALQQGRIHQLLVSPDLHSAGQQCTGCRAIVLDAPEACPYCGGTLAASADVVNLVVHAAIDAGLKVSVLDRSPRLAEVGGIAAVLRY